MKIFFLVFTPEFEEKIYLCPQIFFCPPPVMLLSRQACFASQTPPPPKKEKTQMSPPDFINGYGLAERMQIRPKEAKRARVAFY